MTDPVPAACFEHVSEADDIAFDIGHRVFKAVADTRLRREMDHSVDLAISEGTLERRLIGQIGADEAILCTSLPRDLVKRGQTGFFQSEIVVVVDDVETHNAVAALKEPASSMEADKSGISCDQHAHHKRPA